MLLTPLLIVPLLGVFTLDASNVYQDSTLYNKRIKGIALITSFINLFISFIVFILFDFTNIIYLIGIVIIVYASFTTLRTIDVK